jgi:hypothetical protein
MCSSSETRCVQREASGASQPTRGTFWRPPLFGRLLFLSVGWTSHRACTRPKKMFKTGHRVLFKPVVFQLQLRGTIDPNPTVAGPPPTHNLLLLPMRIYRHCQRGRNGYLRICRCICSFLIKRLANLLGGYSYVALVHPLRSQLFP